MLFHLRQQRKTGTSETGVSSNQWEWEGSCVVIRPTVGSHSSRLAVVGLPSGLSSDSRLKVTKPSRPYTKFNGDS